MAYTGKTPVNFVDVTQSQSMNVTDDLTVDTNTLVVDSANNRVGIGTSLPSALLGVNGRVTLGNQATSGTAGAGGMIVGAGAFYIQSSENQNSSNKAPIVFSNIGGSSESMRIDSSGNLLVGTTNTNPADNNVSGTRLGGQAEFSVSGGPSAEFNRITSDGDIVRFKKDGTTVGSIGSNSGVNLIIGTGDTGIYFNSGSDAVHPWNTSTNSARNNGIDLGRSTDRWRDIYTDGAVNTSDQNKKQQIAELTTSELAAAKRISALFKTFKWNDAVAEKGNNARTHSGVIAQDVRDALIAEGLDAAKYAFWCSNTWWETQTEVPAVEANEENGIEAQDAYTRTDTYDTAEEAPEGATERTLQSVRYNELMAFVGAATEQRLASIESRLDALENA